MSTTGKAPQRLPTMTLTECEVCKSRVYFRARSSTPSADPRYKVEYLVCPVCGASATQLREIEQIVETRPKRSRVKYRYLS